MNPLAESHAGAQGLMQLMPITAKEVGVKDVWDPQEKYQWWHKIYCENDFNVWRLQNSTSGIQCGSLM